jgi:hypothetical protein
MRKHLVNVAIMTTISVSAPSSFAASGYGPAPHYKPLIGAPASQRGPSSLTIFAEQAEARATKNSSIGSFGGMREVISQSGAGAQPSEAVSFYSHH